MARPKKIVSEVNANPEAVSAQELIDENEQLKRELAEAKAVKEAPTQQNDVMTALAQLIAKGASVQPADQSYASFKAKLNKPFTLTDERKQHIEELFSAHGNGEIEFQWDKTGVPAVTFRRKVYIRAYDADLEMNVKKEVWLSEGLHASLDDRTFKHRIKELLSIKSAK